MIEQEFYELMIFQMKELNHTLGKIEANLSMIHTDIRKIRVNQENQ